jgi:zinc protease
MKYFSVLFSVVLFSLLPASGQENSAKSQWPHEKSDLKPDPKAVFGSMENGLRYVILPNTEPPKRVSIRLHIASGALMEADNQQGLAHFLEHMAFNGTKNYPADEMVKFFQRLGMGFGADTNAHTGFDETVYKLELPDNAAALLSKGMLFMRDVADGMIIGPQEIEKERGVIMSEKNARDSVEYRTMIEGFKFSLPESLIPKRLPIGTPEVIKTAPKQRFLEYYRKWYVPNRMVVIVTGDVAVEDVKKSIAEHFTSLKAPAAAASDPDMGKVTTGKGLLVKLHTEKEAGQVTISVGVARPSQKPPDNTETRRLAMIRQLANAMLNRRFDILAKKPDSPFLAAQADYEDWLHFVESYSLELTAKPENWDKALAAGEQELRRAVLHGFTKSELGEATANLLTSAENSAAAAPTRKSRELADSISRGFSERKVFTHPADVLAWIKTELPKVTAEQCHEALRAGWNSDDVRIFIGGNLTLDNAEAVISEAWKKSRSKEVAPQKEDASAAWAYTNFGEPGKITVQKTVDDLQITQVQFANGVRLNIKPTDFKKDTIEVSANFGDGRLTLPKDKPGLPMFTQFNLEQAALGKHSIDDLKRVLAGKTADINFEIGDESFGFRGKTNRKDLKTQFQLLAAFLSDPGWRDDGVALLKQSLPAIYQQVEHTPDGVMTAKVNAFTHGDDYRFVFPKQEELAARTIDEMKAWLEPQLKTGYLEIGIVGDLDVQAVLDAATATVGALPARATERSNHDDLRKVAFPKGTPEKEFVFDSKIPKSTAFIFWPTTDRMKDIKLSRQLSLLGEVLSDRVRIKVREELGESYSPSVASMMSDTWTGYGQMMAMMVANAKDTKELTDIAAKLGAELAAMGATDDELDRARKPLLTQLEEQRRNNLYWLNTVVTPSQSKPERLDWARTILDDFKSVKLEDINRLAKEYLASNATAIRIVSSAKGGEEEEKK